MKGHKSRQKAKGMGKKATKAGMTPQYTPSTKPNRREAKTARPSPPVKMAEYAREPVNVLGAGNDLNAMQRRQVRDV